MKKIKLVLSGSGTRYPVHLGGILRLVEEGYEITEVCGTSGGAFVAAIIASGYKINDDLIQLAKDTLPAKNNLIDYSFFSLFLKWGIIKGNKIEKFFAKHIVSTFKETSIPLHVVTTNLNRKAGRIFSTVVDPEMSVVKAVRASMSIPGVFAPVRIDSELYVDGGVTGNFMLDIFGTGEDVVGLYFGPTSQLQDWTEQEKVPINNVKDFISANVAAMMSATTKEHLDDAIYARAIPLFSTHHGLNLYMNDKDVDEMVKEGYMSVDKWLKIRNTG